MKIHTKVIIDLASGEVLEDEHYEYEGLIEEAKGGGGGSSGGTQTQIQEPWAEQKPFLKTGFKRAQGDVLNRPLEFFPGSTVVPYSPETEVALGAQTGRAITGSPLLSGAQDYTGDVLGGSFFDTPTIRGDRLDPTTNPFFSGVSDAVLSQVQPQVASQFARAGRTGGSPLAQEALGRGVSRGLAPYLFQEYGRERGLQESAFGRERGFQESAAARAPGLAREDYADIGKLRDVGQAREELSSANLAEDMARHAFGQAEPGQRLEDYMRLITGSFGGTTTTQLPQGAGSNPLMQLAGGADLGTGLAK
ncbi:hypothetical protein LCGC14_2842380 [marine sediment metagenome]|uniref:Uncharacterized protein n=1 Tax=marine sediment metagenome TaxID=412755 RepID=A0A0F8YAV9_9ZZZZ